MLLVYSLLVENRERLINLLVQHVRAESRVYHRISRPELKESLSAMFDAYADFLVSKNKHKLKIILGYWVRLRLSQAFHLNAILKAALCFGPILRLFLQQAYRKMPEQEAVNYNKAMAAVEQSIFEMTDLLIETFEEQKQEPRPPKKTVDLSKLTIFRG